MKWSWQTLVVLLLFTACKKEEKADDKNDLLVELSGKWQVDSTVTTIYENNQVGLRMVEVDKPYSWDFSSENRMIYRKHSEVDTATFLFRPSYIALTDFFQDTTSIVLDTAHIVIIEKDVRVGVMRILSTTWGGVEYKSEEAVFLRK